MDPAVPWSAYAAAASYNRLANATGTFQTAASEFQNTGLAGHQSGGQSHSSANQLLLQAHTTAATLAGQLGQSTTFNPGGFLSPPPVGYDAVFSPLFHHANPKPAHYSSSLNVTQHRAQALANAVSSKQNSVESELTSLRENYSQAHHPTLAAANAASTYFDHQSSSSPSAWTHQGNSQLPSPFGILPHESVVSSPGPTKTTTSYENTFNAAHFAAQSLNHLNSQITSAAAEYSKTNSNYSDSKKSNRSQSPLVTPVKPVASSAPTIATGTAPAFFQHQSNPTTFAESGTYQKSESYSSKNYASSNAGSSITNSQQTCIVSTASSNQTTNQSKSEYRIPQPPSRTSSTYLNQNARSGTQNATEKTPPNRSTNQNFVSPPTKTTTSQHAIQTKAQTKIYPELANQSTERRTNSENLETSQSSPISFALSYPPNKNVQRSGNNQYVVNQNYRYNENEYHNRKTGSADSAYSSGSNNGPECNVAIPRRPSPLQAHSQASPLGHVPSPAYPMYNSPMASMSSPSNVECPSNNYKNSQVTPPSPLDVTVSRTQNSQQNVAYPSVITRAENAGNTNSRTQQNQLWESENNQRQNRQNSKFPNANYNNIETNQVNVTPQRPNAATTGSTAVLNISERQQAYFDSTPSHNVTLQDLSSCRGDPMSIVKNLQTLQNCNSVPAPTEAPIKAEEAPRPVPVKNQTQKNRRKSNEKNTTTASANLNDLAGMAEFLTNRVPPPAHHNTQSQQQQNGAYFDFERWNLPHPPPKMFTGAAGAFASHGTNFVSNPAHQHQGLMVPHPHHPPPPIPYFPAFHIPPGHHPHHPQEFHPSVEITPIPFSENSQPSNSNYQHQDVKEENPKVIVPDIEEELGYLSQTAHAQVVAASQNNPASQQLPPPIKMPVKKHNDPNSGFMASYLKFLQGERDTSPPPPNRGGRKATWSRTKLYVPEIKSTTSVVTSSVTTTTPTVAPGNTATTLTPGSAIRVNAIAEPKKGNEKPYNPDDDPRFYPLPKSTAKRKLDSDSSDEDSKGKTYTQMTNVSSSQLSDITRGVNATPKKLGRPPSMKSGSQPMKKRSPTDASGKFYLKPIISLRFLTKPNLTWIICRYFKRHAAIY